MHLLLWQRTSRTADFLAAFCITARVLLFFVRKIFGVHHIEHPTVEMGTACKRMPLGEQTVGSTRFQRRVIEVPLPFREGLGMGLLG